MAITPTTPAPSTPVTVLGLGAMGRALAGAFLGAGHPTTVWNRSAAKADELVGRGAVRAGSVAEAVTAGPLVVVCVLDYEVAHRILEPVGADLAGRVLVNLTSDTPQRSRQAAEWAAGHGIDYLDGSIMVPTPVIGTPDATVLYSGSRRAFDTYEETLKALGGRAPYLGADHGTAAVYDLAMLSFFYSGMAGIAHAFTLAGEEGVPATDLAPFLDVITGIFPPIAAGMADDLAGGRLDGAGEGSLTMEAAGVGHIIEASRDRGVTTDVLDALKALMDRAIAAGHGESEFVRVTEVMRGAYA
ncbi:NAD(P)-binding domain-containing protein [Streptomyces sp. NPDC052496]|uniref:NAD(P)-dependent oxidoreductase n=1 Tax=Streptomyces sp. NPDC052496 TaxID=3154951 RepID=UPI00342F6518